MRERCPSPISIGGDLDAEAIEALEVAERMSPGVERTEALKKAGLIFPRKNGQG